MTASAPSGCEAVTLRTQPAPVRAAPPRPRGRRGVWSRPPLVWLRLGYLSLLNAAFSGAYRTIRSHYRLWHRLSGHYGPTLDGLARLHAYLMCAWAKKRVPAYAEFLADNGHVFRLLELSAFPETTKENYVRRYGFAARCRQGRIPRAGTIVDESAGSSGTPFDWLRSAEELRDVHLNTSNWIRYTFPTER